MKYVDAIRLCHEGYDLMNRALYGEAWIFEQDGQLIKGEVANGWRNYSRFYPGPQDVLSEGWEAYCRC